MATIIVTSAVATNLRELSRRLDKGDMDGMFSVGLSATGAAPATHFISTGCVPKPLLVALRSPAAMFNAAKAAWVADGDVFPFTQAQVTNALNKCDVSSAASDSEGPLPETPQQAMTRLGLVPIAAAGP